MIALLLVGGGAAVYVMNWDRWARESFARNKSGVLRSRLQSVAIALERYRADHGAYPASVTQLSTPVHYETPRGDPFNSNHNMISWSRRDIGWCLWGNGPDEDNDAAAVHYDATNGIISDGDIILASPEEAGLLISRHTLPTRNIPTH